MVDLLIQNGNVIDGTGKGAFPGDLAVQNGRILDLGQIGNVQAKTVVSARGKVVAPGFIDVHNHSEGWLLKNPAFFPKVQQGFTTEIMMSDGIAYAPVSDRTVQAWFFYLASLSGLSMADYTGWKSLSEFSALFDGAAPVNTGFLVPYGNVRVLASAFGTKKISSEQVGQMKKEIERALAEGALGLSTGFDYVEQIWATTNEVVEACQPLGKTGRPYVTHIRYSLGIPGGLKEAVEIGKRTGAPVHISHLIGRDPRTFEEILDYIDKTASQEVDFTFDVVPYYSGSTMINYMLPYDAWEEGPAKVLERMKDPGRQEAFSKNLAKFNLDLLHIAYAPSPESRWTFGRSVSDLSREMGLAPDKALLDLLYQNDLCVLMVNRYGPDDAIIHPFVTHPKSMISTDGVFFPNSKTHPRTFGTTGRILGDWVRNRKLFNLETAVRKLTGFPAQRFGLKDRGTLEKGKAADIVIFDPDTVDEKNTYQNPEQAPSGIETVWTNGVCTMDQGKPVIRPGGHWPGKVLVP